jgi:hypothetical protein
MSDRSGALRTSETPLPAGKGDAGMAPGRPVRPSVAGRWSGLADPVLIGALALGAVLRVWGLGYGLPHVYNPDEVSILSRALALGQGTLNPQNFVYPSLYFYVLAAAAGASFAVQYLLGLTTSLAAFEASFWQDPSDIYLLARSLSAAAGILTVAAVYALGQRVGGRPPARLAALFMAVAYIPVRDAHFVKHDVAVTLVLVLVALAAWHIWQHGRTRHYVAGGALAGLAFALHYYAAFAVVPVIVAHLLRAGLRPAALADRRPWLAAAVFCLVFAAGSPYLLIELPQALEDIRANRQIVVDRSLDTYGVFGGAWVHAQILVQQGAGLPLLLAVVFGAGAIVQRSAATALWLFSFPVTFFLFISNAWPYGRLQNPLYPFLAVAAAAGILWITRQFPRPRLTVAALTLACMLQPAMLAVLMNHLMTQTDTRTLAREWIHTHVPAGAGIAVQPYSVPLTPDRDWLAEVVRRQTGTLANAGYRTRRQLARSPYPAPAYRLIHLGVGGLDEDKIFRDPAELIAPGGLDRLRRDEVSIVVLKRFVVPEADPLRDRVRAEGRLLFRASPFRDGEEGVAQLPDYDIRPSLDVVRPGPIIEIWELRPQTGEARAASRADRS